MTFLAIFETLALLALAASMFYAGHELWKRWRRVRRLTAEVDVLRRGNDELSQVNMSRIQRYVQRSLR